MAKKEALNLLVALKETGDPPPYKSYYLQYTAGDEFRSLARKIVNEISMLSTERQGYSPRVICGDYGVGKTHFLRYLYLKLGEDISEIEHTLCSWIDLRELNENPDFQYLFIKGLTTFNNDVPENNNYQNVLKIVYHKLADPIIKNKKVTENQRKVIIRQVLDRLWEVTNAVEPITIPFKWYAKFILEKRQREQEKKRLERLQQKSVSEELGDNSHLALQDNFVHQFIALGEGKSSHPEFDLFIQNLASESRYGQLTDLIMRLLNQAGYQRLVIIIDEMEHINLSPKLLSEYSHRSAEILNLFFKLHTKIARYAGQNKWNSYPSIAQIMVMPDYLLEDVTKLLDPALHDRWNLVRFPLDIIPKNSPTADEIIRNIWKLHQEAGYKLKPNSEIAFSNIKESLYSQLINDKEPATMRHIIPRIIVLIQTDWIYKYEL